MQQPHTTKYIVHRKLLLADIRARLIKLGVLNNNTLGTIATKTANDW